MSSVRKPKNPQKRFHPQLLLVAILLAICTGTIIFMEREHWPPFKLGGTVRAVVRSEPPVQPATTPVIQPGPVHDYTIPAIQNGNVPVISRIPTKQPVVFLTIDDGIVTNSNDAAWMQASQTKATFFLVYRFIKNNPDFFGTLAQQTGSDIENHSYDHYLLTNLTYDQQKTDICQNADVFTPWFGKRPVLFRPSGGAYNDDTLRASTACGMKALVMWDATINNGAVQYAHGHSLQPGDIVLMHFRTTFQEDLAAFTAAAQSAGLQPDLLINWLPS